MLSEKSLCAVLAIHEAKAKFLFLKNIADWLAAYIIPYNSKTLADIMLYAERIGGIQ